LALASALAFRNVGITGEIIGIGAGKFGITGAVIGSDGRGQLKVKG
jgi:hypothetical protein